MNNIQKPQQISNNDIPSFGVDIQIESLKKYLDDISGALNQHAQKINAIENSLPRKVETQKMADILSFMSEGFGLFDNNFAKITKALMGLQYKPLQIYIYLGNGRAENSQSVLDNSLNKMVNREVQISHGLTYIYTKIQQIEPNLNDHEERLKNKVSVDLWKEKKKKHKRLFQSLTEQLRLSTDQKIMEIDRRLSDQVRVVQEKQDELEKKTVWRVGELDNQMRSKINKFFVDDSCRSLEEKLKREFAQSLIDSEKNLQMHNENRNQIKYVEEQIMEKVRLNKSTIVALEDGLERRFVGKLAFDEQKKGNLERFGDLMQRMKDLERKSDFVPLFDRVSNKLRVVEEKVQEMDIELQRKFTEIMLHQQKEEYKKQQDENIHKICTLEGLVRNLQNDLIKHKQDSVDQESDALRRMEMIEADIKNSPFGMKRQNSEGIMQKLTLQDLATQKELLNSIDSMALSLQEQLQQAIDQVYMDLRKNQEEATGGKAASSLNEAFRRIDTIEQRVAKTSRELDTTSLFKQLRDKADNEHVRRDFMVQETKISQIQETNSILRKELDNMGRMYQKMLGSMRDGTLHTVEEQLVVMSKRLLPASCISCNVLPSRLSDRSKKNAQTLKTAQRNDGYVIQQNQLMKVMGSDKRPYKIDVNYLASQQAQLTEALSQGQQVQNLLQQTQQTLYQAQIGSSHIQTDLDVLSLAPGGQAYLHLDRSPNSNSIPILTKKGSRPSTAKIMRSEARSKHTRPESAKQT